MTDIALCRPRKSALWCPQEDNPAVAVNAVNAVTLSPYTNFSTLNAREGLGMTALTAHTAGLGGAGVGLGDGPGHSVEPAKTATGAIFKPRVSFGERKSSMTTTIVSPALAAGVPFSERTRLVAEANPALIETLERAAQEYHRHEDTWHEECSRHQRAGGMPERRLESPYGRALREAAAAVVEKFEELLAAGAVTYAPRVSHRLKG